MKTKTLLLALMLCFVPCESAELPGILNHQGRVSVGGVNFEGTGNFKFALVSPGTNVSVYARATATVTSGFVTSITVTEGGSGYATAPEVYIMDPFDGGSGAIAHAIVSGGSVIGVVVTNAGSGYSEFTDVWFDSPVPNYVYQTYWSHDGTSVGGSEPQGWIQLPVTNGLYSVLLGDESLDYVPPPDTDPHIPFSVFDNPDVRLRIWFNDGIHGFQHLAPDQRLASVGYAMVAGGVPDKSITSAKIAAGAISNEQVSGISQDKIDNLLTDLSDKVSRSGDMLTGQYFIEGTIDTGHGSNELFAMDQDVRTTDSPTFAGLITSGTLVAGNINTGQGTTEVFPMDQNLRTSDAPTFESLSISGTLLTGTLNTGLGATELYPMDQPLGTTDSATFATLNTGHGDNELFAMDQSLRTTDSPSFASLNTGQGATELHLMNQNLRNTDAPTFASLTTTGALVVGTINTGQGITEVYPMDQSLRIADNPTFATLNTGQGGNELYPMNQGVRSTDSPTFAGLSTSGTLTAGLINTGPGANELYAMDQNVRTLDSPIFNGLTTTGVFSANGDLRIAGATGGFYGTLDVGSLSANTTYVFNGNSGTVMTSGNDGIGSGFDADLLDGQSSDAFAAASHIHSAEQIATGTLSDMRLSPNVALLGGMNNFLGNQTISASLRVQNRIGIGRDAMMHELEVEGDASKTTAGSWLANSDARIKQDVRRVNGALETLDKVRLVDFRYTDSYRADHPAIEDRRYVNVIAQEFAEVFPEHVKPGADKLPDGSPVLQVDTYPLAIYSAAAVQELHAETKDLRRENEELRARVTRLEALLNESAKPSSRP